ncbi:MAG: hypothetical protein JSR82_13975 [Verrucomicrobia bacterium]|nr:hypothetical protein [Verrucomicrobiota bacterium]
MEASNSSDFVVLIVSDHAHVRRLVRDWMWSPRIRRLPATTTASTRSRARERAFDLIVFDAGVEGLGMEGIVETLEQCFPRHPKLVLGEVECGEKDWADDRTIVLPGPRRVRHAQAYRALCLLCPELERLLPVPKSLRTIHA